MTTELSISNSNPKRVPGPELLHRLIDRRSNDGQAAIEYHDADGFVSRVTYGELHHRTNCLANRLLNTLKAVTAASKRLVIPIFIQQNTHLYVSQLASLKAGGAFCPIALDVPEERLRFILNDVKASVLLTTTDLESKLPNLEHVQIIAVDEDVEDLDPSEPPVSITPQDTAYILYTSGSTGQPKGVLIPHSSATQALLAHDKHIPSFSRFLQFASPTFDVSVFEIFFPWFRGATLVSCDRRRLLNDLPSAIDELRVDAAELTPSVANNLLRGRESVPSLGLLLTIGEMLKPGVVEEFGGTDNEPGILYGMYGPTEATIHCTLHPSFPKNMACGSIGVPLDTVSAFIIQPMEQDVSDDKIKILPLGDEGELAIGGFQLADGYLNREEQTKAAFVKHPEHGRLYRTGDRAKMLPDGRFECLGRISTGQVKLRGQRIELGEIEYAASKSVGCRSSVAEVISGILVLFCVGEDSSLTKESVGETCRKWLPSFMVPGDIVVIDKLPYLNSGKLDRKALQNIYTESQVEIKEMIPLQDASTRSIIDVLEAVLGCSVNPGSKLSSLGLDSIASIRIAAELKRKGYPQLDATQVLVARTPLDVVSVLDRVQTEQQSHNTDESSSDEKKFLVPVEQLSDVVKSEHEIDYAFRCTAVQSAMLGETCKSSEMYCNWVELQVTTDADTLKSALLQLSSKHPLLRSGFVMLPGGEVTFATVVWKELLPEQISIVSTLDYTFRIESDQDLLRPLNMQIIGGEKDLRLLLRIHHAMYDQWSIDVLRADLSTLLSQRRLDQLPGFDSVAKTYAKSRTFSTSDSSFGFWQDYLRNATFSPLPLLTSRRGAPMLESTPWRSTQIPSASLKGKSQELQCSSPSVFQAALFCLLGGYIGSTDIVLGSVFSGRTLAIPDIDRVFGPCLATLPLRVDMSSAHTRHDLLSAITQLNRNLQKHLMTPPHMIKKAAGISPGAPMFDVLFVWQQSSIGNDDTVKEVNSADRHEFNLVLEFDPSTEHVNARATYRRNVISAHQVDILLRQIGTIVQSILYQPSQLVTSLGHPLTLDLLSIANPHPESSLPSQDLVSILEAVAHSNPTLPAIVFTEDLEIAWPSFSSISYEFLDLQSNRLANALISFGTLPDDLICICMEKSIDLYVSIIAIIKAGAGYLPLLPETPRARVKSILAQSTTRLCLCDSSIASTFSENLDAEVIDLTKLDLSHFSRSPPKVPQHGSRIAYVVFTSGSTGEPKGVPVTIDNLHSNLVVLSELYETREGDRLLQACSQAFDVSVFEIFFTFYSGITLCSAPKDTLFRDFEHSINAFGITHLSLTPTVAALVNPLNVPEVRFLVTAGEGITDRVFNTWVTHGLHQGYGPSETTNICSVNMNVSAEDAINNVGQPFRNTSAFVIAPEEEFRILPAGYFGELAFGGEQVFQGYVAMPDLNAKKIINHPNFGRIYRSGDTGYMLHDGTLLISGRLDDQVKIRGNRVELGEINAVLMRCKGIVDCTTLVFRRESSEQMITAFYVPDSGADSNKTEIVKGDVNGIDNYFKSLVDALPGYMVPSMIIPITRLPRTSQGKLDKRQLESICGKVTGDERNSFSLSHDQNVDDEPFEHGEEEIARRLAKILDVTLESITRHTSFFALGLNSLNAIQFAKAIEPLVDSKVSVTTVLRNPSIARLNSSLSSIEATSPSEGARNLHETFATDISKKVREEFKSRNQEVEAVIPCTPLQEAMLSAGGSTSSGAYSNVTKLRVIGDIKRIKQCWQTAVRRHAILRTTFVETPVAAHPYAQVILKDVRLPWFSRTETALSNGHSKEPNTQVQSEHVSSSYPLRIELETGREHPGLILHMHHAIYDGVSMSNLLKEIETLYEGEEVQDPVSFEQFLAEIAAHNDTPALEYWSEKFRGFRPHPLPNPSRYGFGQEQTISVDLGQISNSIATFCETYSVTALSIYQSAWVKVLTCAQAVTDACFGNVVSGRTGTLHDVERLIAPCFNTIPLRVDVDILRTNIELIRCLHNDNINNFEFQLTALRRIQTFSADPSVHLFDSLLLLQPPSVPLNPSIWTLESETGAMDLPLVMEILPHHDTTTLSLHFLDVYVDNQLANGLLDGFKAALNSCIQFASSSVDHFLDFDAVSISGKLLSDYSHVRSDANGVQDQLTDDHEWNDAESAIRKIFAELSGIETSKISKDTSLYQIGLDSLNAVQVASLLRQKAFNVDAADVMQNRTPASIAQVILSSSGAEPENHDQIDFQKFDNKYRSQVVEFVGLDEKTLEAVRPCTPAQSGMLAQSLQTEGRLYINSLVYRVPDGYNHSQIRKAWSSVQQKQQILRTGFVQIEDHSNPFLMVVHNTETPHDLMDTIVLNTPSGEHDVRALIVQNLYLPAWRVDFVGSEKVECTMRLTIHHALYDAESLRILLSDFASALHSQDFGQPIGFDAALSGALKASDVDRAEGKKFWTDALRLAGFAKFPDLCPAVVADAKSESVQLKSSANHLMLDEFCRKNGVTIQAIGQSMWASLLASYTGESRVTFGTVFSGHISNLPVGCSFPSISTFPVFCDTTKSSLDVVKDMLSFNALAQKHRFTPLTEIQRYAGKAGQALFDTVFVYQKSSLPTNALFDWELLSETAAVDYNVSLELDLPSQGSLELRLTFNNKIVPSAHALLMLRQYDNLLQTLLQPGEGGQPAYDDLWSVLPAKENELPCSVKALHEFVEIGARNHPDKPALEFITSLENGSKGRKMWTYKELEEQSNQIAHVLKREHVEPGGVVAVCMSKCAEASLIFTAISKAGCAFLAMDPDLPDARKNFILEDSNSQVLFIDHGASWDSEGNIRVIECIPGFYVDMPMSPVEIPFIDLQATSYCLYTSGTTGTPKGCELTNENAVQAMMSFQRLFSGHWTESSRWLQFASYWFDVSVLEQFWSWSIGITVVGAPRDLVLGDLVVFLNEANITHIDLTPSLARLVTPEDVPSLCNGVFITGGEALKQEIINNWGPKNVICNGYGPTEATIGVTMNRFIGTDAKPSNIGTQFDNVGTLVLDPDSDKPVLRGGVGELCISGKLVGKGYLNRPDQTSKSFPYLEKLGERVYRTGDLVRMLSDGSFSFIGRKDTQAKLRGQRLEIDEIDSVIKSSSTNILEVASLVSKGSDGNREMLVSFIAFQKPSKSEVRIDPSESARNLAQVAHQACKDRLPGYMVPTHIVPISNIPLTVNNKVDSKSLVGFFESLSQQELQKLRSDETDARKMFTAERRIAHVLDELLTLGEDNIGPTSNIFSLGLSSISAIAFATVLKRSGFKSANVASVMNNPTIDRLAKALTTETDSNRTELNAVRQAQLTISAFSQRFRTSVAAALSRDVSEIESLAPCTPLQEGLLLESIKSSNRPYFNQFKYVVKLGNSSILRSRLEQLILNVQILRTVFVRTDDGFAQAILRNHSVDIHQCSVADKELEKVLLRQKEAWQTSASQDVISPFEVLIIQTPSRIILTLHAHHAIYDGISWDLIMKLLEHTCNSRSPRSVGPKFIEALPFGPLCIRPDAKAYWAERMRGTTKGSLAGLTSEPDVQIHVVRSKFYFADSDETKRRSLGVSHQAIFEASFVAALSHQFSEIQTYGVVVSGRSISFDNSDSIIGPMFNTMPSAIRISSSDTWEDHVRRCHEANVAALPFQHTPLRDIRRFCNRPPYESLFDVLFVFQRRDKSTSESVFQEIESQADPDHPLAFEVELMDSGQVSVIAVSKSAGISEETLQDLADQFREGFSCLMNNPSELVGSTVQVNDKPQQQLSEPRTNGVHYANGHANAEWTEQASIIRNAIVQLADCEIDDVAQDTTFFALGLDSIDAIKLSSRLKKSDILIPVSRILQAQTISRMLETVGANESNRDDGSGNRLQTLEQQLESLRDQLSSQDGLDVERILPASPGQEALIAEMIKSEFREYYNYDILRLSKDTDLEKLRLAWQRAIHASPILRTSFTEITDSHIDAVFAQVVHRPTVLQFDHTSAESIDALSDSFDAIREEVLSTFSRKPSLRLTIASVKSEEYLILSLSHAQYDGHSLALIHDDVARAYQDQLEQRPSYDFILDEALGATSSDAIRFWRGSLTGCRTSRVVAERETCSTDAVHRAERFCSLSALEARNRCQRLGISLQTLAQTAWAMTLAEYSRSLEVMFGVVLACRDSEEAEQVIFPTMNTVPLQAHLHGTAHQMLQYVQSAMNDILPYQRTPLRAIQRACASVKQNSSIEDGHGLFDTLFIYQHRPKSSETDQSSIYESVKGKSDIDYPIAAELEVVDDKVLVRSACKDSILNRQDTHELLQKYDKMLDALLETGDQPCLVFDGDMVSICGLPSFRVKIDGHEEQSNNENGAEEIDDVGTDMSPVTLSIKSALSQVSGVSAEEILPNTTIESIGIDSISAIKVAALLRKQSVKIAVSDILKANTLSKMAKKAGDQPVSDSNTSKSSAEILNTALQALDINKVLAEVRVAKENVESILPASAGQVYMLKMWQRTEGQIFLSTFQYHLRGPYTIDDVRRAWEETVEQQALLRTVFCNTQNSKIPLVQVIVKEAPSSFIVGKNTNAWNGKSQPMFALFAEPIEDGFLLNLKIHHALYDAVSLPTITQDLELFLTQSQLQRPTISFADFLALSIDPATQTTRENFWRSRFHKINPATLTQPSKQGSQRKIEIFKPSLIPKASNLESLARKQGLALQSLLFAAYSKIYFHRLSSSHAGKTDVILGIYLSNRSQLPDLDQLPAPTLNLLPLAIRDVASREIWDLAKSIQDDLREMSRGENCGTGLGEIEVWTRGAAGGEAGVKVDSFVNFLKLPDKSPRNGRDGVIEEVEGGVRKERSLVLDPTGGEGGGGFELPLGLKGEVEGVAYQHSVDLEITVANGELDLGFFGQEEMVGLDLAEGAIGEFKRMLEELVEE